MQEIIYCRKAPSLGALEDTEEKIWGTPEYEGDRDAPTVFFGLYGFPDFYTLWRHRGKKWILWAGSDIRHFQNGYWLDGIGQIRLDSQALARWINDNCESWVENEVERKALEDMGIAAKVGQSFLGDVSQYPVSFTPNHRPNVYLSASSGREVEYGWGLVEEIAGECAVDFHLYGSDDWKSEHHNVIVHGRKPKEKMNEEIRHMQSGLRLNDFDGFSEVTAKSILWGQYPIVRAEFGYQHITCFNDKNQLIKRLNQLRERKEPNPAREYYITNLNKFPWAK